MDSLKAATIKRLIAFVVGVAAVALNKKLGLDLDVESQAMLVTLILGYIGQSSLKEAKVESAKAAAGVTDTKTALTVLGDRPPGTP